MESDLKKILKAVTLELRHLLVWQKSMALVKQVYQDTSRFPKDELYALTNQIRRAAVSIPSNIAEGHARDSTKEFLYHLSIALGHWRNWKHS